MVRDGRAQATQASHLDQEVAPVCGGVHLKALHEAGDAFMAQPLQCPGLTLEELQLAPVLHAAQGEGLDGHQAAPGALCLQQDQTRVNEGLPAALTAVNADLSGR